MSADTLELLTAERLDGQFIRAAQNIAVISVGGQEITMPLEKVRAIYLGAAPTVTSTPKAAPIYREAVEQLQALSSITSTGVSYMSYTPRALEAKIKVDRYLATPPTGDEHLRGLVSKAMRYYEIAGQVWNSKISQTPGGSLGEVLIHDPAFLGCLEPSIPMLKQHVDILTGLMAERLALLWNCAKEELVEIDKVEKMGIAPALPKPPVSPEPAPAISSTPAAKPDAGNKPRIIGLE